MLYGLVVCYNYVVKKAGTVSSGRVKRFYMLHAVKQKDVLTVVKSDSLYQYIRKTAVREFPVIRVSEKIRAFRQSDDKSDRDLYINNI